MDQKTAWYLFETTGNVEAYLLYQNLAAQDGKHPAAPRRAARPKGDGYHSAGDTKPPFSTQL